MSTTPRHISKTKVAIETCLGLLFVVGVLGGLLYSLVKVFGSPVPWYLSLALLLICVGLMAVKARVRRIGR